MPTSTRTAVQMNFTDEAKAQVAELLGSTRAGHDAKRLLDKIESGSVEALLERSVNLPVEDAFYGDTLCLVQRGHAGVIFHVVDEPGDPIEITGAFEVAEDQPTVNRGY